MSKFTVYPAIDLRNGQVVRLQQGDPNRQTTFGNDPAAAARRWLEEGAQWLHVVNLDGAFGEGDSANQDAVTQVLGVAQTYGARVQFGGGLRSMQAVERVLALGVSRAVLGTVAVREPEVVVEALRRFGAECVAVGLDARAGEVKISGWLEGTDIAAPDLAAQFGGAGLKWLVYTDIARDGLGSGVNVQETLEVAQRSGLSVIASGGVKSVEDVQKIKAAGLPGVIVGRALYDGAISLRDIL